MFYVLRLKQGEANLPEECYNCVALRSQSGYEKRSRERYDFTMKE